MFRIGRGKPVIDPYERVSEKNVHVPSSRVLLFFTPFLFKTAIKIVEELKEVKYSGLLFKSVKGRYGGEEVFLTLPYFGAPAATAALEVLIAGGGKTFIMVGEAGAINPVLRIGDILVPTWGLREEGTSYHYMPPDYVPRPDAKLARTLFHEVKRVKGRKKIRVLRGGIWSTDAIFRETTDKIVEYSKMGILGVDMEATALMTVAAYRKVRLAVVAAISDELYGKQWNPGFGTRKLKRTEKIIVEAALKAITKHE